MYKEEIIVICYIHEDMKALFESNVDFSNFKPDGNKVTSKL